MAEMIKNIGLSLEETTLLRERFIVDYSKQKGWNHKELSTQQMLEIVNQKGYKTPGIILG
jgi:hypothetical protein